VSAFDYFKRRPAPPQPVSDADAAAFLAGTYLPVTSSCVQGARYDPGARTFQVDWYDQKTGRTAPRLYDGVGDEVARAFLEAPSKGSFCSRTFSRAKWPGRPL
jgi:hypothetical protein